MEEGEEGDRFLFSPDRLRLMMDGMFMGVMKDAKMACGVRGVGGKMSMQSCISWKSESDDVAADDDEDGKPQ